MVYFALKFWLSQALVASYISKEDYANVKDVTKFVLKVLVLVIVTSLCCILLRTRLSFLLFMISFLILHFAKLFFQIGLVTGVTLGVILGMSFSSLAPLFTKDVEVLRVVRTGILVSKTCICMHENYFIYCCCLVDANH